MTYDQDGTPKGGSEILARELRKRLGQSLQGINLVLNNCNVNQISSAKKNVLWNHLSYDQEAVKDISRPEFLRKVEKIVFVSHWQFEKYRYFHNIQTDKSVVIRNAIPLFETQPEKSRESSRKLRLIYTSTPWRGLSTLLDAFQILDRDDVELHVYSSTKIYGVAFHRAHEEMFKGVFDRARGMPNVTLYDYVPNEVVREALNDADVYVYPSTFEETSCLSAIEAAMAGCALVTTNYGALYETLGDWANFVNIETDSKLLAIKFAGKLNKVINEFHEPASIEHRKNQKLHFERFWSWDVRLPEWSQFLEDLK